MSVRRFRLELAPRARRDLRDIRVHSRELWGEHQSKIYCAALRRGFDVMRDNPKIGRVRDDLSRPNFRSYAVEHHILYYRLEEDVIGIVRILHERRDAVAALRDEPPS